MRKKTACVLVLLLVASAGGSCRTPRAAARQGIISLVPGATEILFALGAGDQVIGVSDFCQHPPEVRDLPRYGGFLDPSIESIVSSGARAIVVGQPPGKVADACSSAGMEVLVVDTDDLDDMDETIEALGILVDRRDRAADLRDEIHEGLDAIEGSFDVEKEPRVVVVIDRAPDALKRLFVAGPGSLYDDMLSIVHAENAFADMERSYPMVSLEGILDRSPEMILDVRPLTDRRDSLERAETLWDGAGIIVPGGPIRAVHVIDGNEFSVYGPRLVPAARRLAGIIHGVKLSTKP